MIHHPILRRMLLLALLIPILGLALWAPSATEAATNCTYYSDDTYTTVVGQYGYDCCNNYVAWGSKTRYSICNSGCFICYPPPR